MESYLCSPLLQVHPHAQVNAAYRSFSIKHEARRREREESEEGAWCMRRAVMLNKWQQFSNVNGMKQEAARMHEAAMKHEAEARARRSH